MKLTESKLRKIIREELLNEYARIPSGEEMIKNIKIARDRSWEVRELFRDVYIDKKAQSLSNKAQKSTNDLWEYVRKTGQKEWDKWDKGKQ